MEILVGGVILLTITTLCAIVPLLSPYDSEELAGASFEAPSWSHPFGTDEIGRDLFVRVFEGGRVDLTVTAVGTLVPLVVGTALGLAVAIARSRWPDVVLSRLIDALIAFPYIVLLLALVLIVGPSRELRPLPPGTVSILLAIFLVNWTIYARLARAEAKALNEVDYVVAARALGYPPLRIVLHHLAPSVVRTTATYAVADALFIVVLTASLPFVGAGVQPPAPEWGSIMYEGRTVLADAWWVTVMPGLVLVVFGVGVALIADALLERRERR